MNTLSSKAYGKPMGTWNVFLFKYFNVPRGWDSDSIASAAFQKEHICISRFAFVLFFQLLSIVFKALSDHHVFLEGAILKTSMCTPGKSCSETVTPEEIGGATVQALQRTVPPALAGVLVLLLLITYWH